MAEYNFREIENKWQKKWEEKKVFKTKNKVEGKENYYVLEMLPYPSGKLHVGHARNYTIGDVIARYKKMKGYNVLHPMGWDSFGLPAENAAIQNGIHPAIWTESNIDNMRRQLKLLGFSYDWDREIASYTPEYYKWNQWMFKKMYEKGLVYKKSSFVNWCPDCNTVLANEQVEDGMCWRHSRTPVIQKELEQWFFKITDYSEELITGHNELKGGWPEKVLTMQKNWIGKSYGTEINFTVEETGEKLPLFTTRIDTIYGVSYCVLAPEHPLVKEISKNNKDIQVAVEAMKNTDMIERTAEGREKNGIFTGYNVINPVNNERVQLWIGDYVLMNYGTGAVMAVPTHDERDFAFAKKYNLPMKVVINPIDKENKNSIEIKVEDMKNAFIGNGVMTNSEDFDGLNSKEALQKIALFIEEKGYGKRTTKYRLKDWGVSRQRYWGTPIPAIYCDDCGMVMEKDENLPVILPKDVSFNGLGNPLETSESFKNVPCPCCGKSSRRDTDTMDTFVDSSWYYLRYCDPKNNNLPFEKEIVDAWSPVDQYIGGIEHAVMHLLYSRFFHKVLRDLGLLTTNEPFKRLLTQGMVLGPSYYSTSKNVYLYPSDVEIKGEKAFDKKTNEELIVKVEKMSKSKNNGVDPEEMIEKYGTDTTRLFVMFAAPPEKELEWNENGLAGAARFLNKIWRLIDENKDNISLDKIDYSNLAKEEKALVRKLHQTIKKVTESIENDYHFNTAIAANMELLNETQDYLNNLDKENLEAKKVLGEVFNKFVIMLSPFIPHFCDELWEILGNNTVLAEENWVEYKEELTISDELVIAVQVNGKVRGTLEVSRNISKEELEVLALAHENVSKHIEGQNVVKVIIVPSKIVNIVVK
ncbi:MAG: leucine--tRNA ligase [Fusobacteriaceae bacterium]